MKIIDIKVRVMSVNYDLTAEENSKNCISYISIQRRGVINGASSNVI